MEPGRQRKLVTAGAMLGILVAALEATAVAAAIPSAVGELGGVGRYGWVFSAYLLTATVSLPLYGKLADLYGRRPIFHIGIALFLVGSALCGTATSLTQLVVYRALQGLGAGGVLPIAATVVADLYTIEERGRIQGLFSGVWGVASLAGPFLGGLVADALSWRWVFLLAVPPGIAASVLFQRHLADPAARPKPRLDVAGTVTLTAAVTALLLALLEGGDVWGFADPRTLALLAASAVGLAAFVAIEKRAADPTLPPDLFAQPIVAVASAGNVLIGALLYGITAYVPMYAQGVLGGTAADAGAALAPILIGWPISSTLAARWILTAGYRRLSIAGGLLVLAGGVLLAAADPAGGRLLVLVSMFVFGFGLGFLSMPYLLGPQNAVAWNRRGVATSSVQFFRSIGGAVTVAALGALLNARLADRLGPEAATGADALLDPTLAAVLPPDQAAALAAALAHALGGVFLGLAVLSAVMLAVAFATPGGPVRPAGAGAPGADPADVLH